MAWTTATTRSAGFSVTATVWNSEHVDNMNFLKEVNYTEFTSNVSITTTANIDIVSSGAITYENVPHLIEFFCVRASAASSGNLVIALFDGATELGRLASVVPSTGADGLYVARRLTPTAASHTYKIVGYNLVSQTSTIAVGAGGAGTNLPGFIRITRVPT